MYVKVKFIKMESHAEENTPTKLHSPSMSSGKLFFREVEMAL